jgi:hypothetical protein
MNEFQKWWDENGDDCDYYTQQTSWIAALKWALYQIKLNYPSDWDGLDGVKDIQKELEAVKNE